VLGAHANPYPASKTWQVSLGYRYQKSHRHFVGADEQEERAEEGSEVINRIHLLDLGVSYHWSRRTSFGLSVPILLAERSSPIRDASREVVGRSISQARGVSDVAFLARRWMLDPEHHHDENFSLGLGLKLPTGDSSHLGTRQRMVDGEIVTTVETVDQSIQPGDGGFGFVFDGQAFFRFGRVSTYFSGTYLFNPEETDYVPTYRGRESERFMSIADQYLVRFGLASQVGGDGGPVLSFGARLEGVPAEDVLGGSEWFRRPGFAWSLEPGVTWLKGRNGLELYVPVAIHRNRTVSVPDRAAGRHGDAAFADWLILAAYTRSF